MTRQRIVAKERVNLPGLPPDKPATPLDWMKKKDWDALEHLFRMPFLRPEMAKALHYYLEYNAGNMEMPANYEVNLEAARSVVAQLAESADV